MNEAGDNIIDRYLNNKTNYLELKINNDKSLVIVTVPHLICLNDKKRTCDRMANTFASKLIDELNKKGIVRVKRINSEQSRYDTDDNRCEAILKGTPLWNEYAKIITDRKDKKYENETIVLDIHSFPSESFDNESIVILANYPYDDFNFALSDALLNAPIKQAMTGKNAITDYCWFRGIRSALIEVNESMVDANVSLYASKLAEFIKKDQKTQYRTNLSQQNQSDLSQQNQ